MNKRIGLVIAGVAAAAELAGGTAFGSVSSIPDSARIVHGCYDSGANVKVIDTSVTGADLIPGMRKRGDAGSGAPRRRVLIYR
jgi:hypothetical protein